MEPAAPIIVNATVGTRAFTKRLDGGFHVNDHFPGRSDGTSHGGIREIGERGAAQRPRHCGRHRSGAGSIAIRGVRGAGAELYPWAGERGQQLGADRLFTRSCRACWEPRLAATNTAFLLQSSSFIGSPPNPAPDQQGGGIWVRGVGGQVNIKSNTTTTVTQTRGSRGLASSIRFHARKRLTRALAGVQFGADTAKLNVNGWNFHLGTTAGYLATRVPCGRCVRVRGYVFSPAVPAGGGPFTSSTQIPFIGEYAAATNGGFCDRRVAAHRVLSESSLNAPGYNILSQTIDAHGLSFSSSVPGTIGRCPIPTGSSSLRLGYHIPRQGRPFDYLTAGTFAGASLTDCSGTLKLNDIESDIGRVGLRAGTTIDTGNIVWQPFAAVSVWHEFGPNVTANYATCNAKTGDPGCAFFGGGATTGHDWAAIQRHRLSEPTGNTRSEYRPQSPAPAGSALPASITATAPIFKA